jgi:hypothetical protein
MAQQLAYGLNITIPEKWLGKENTRALKGWAAEMVTGRSGIAKIAGRRGNIKIAARMEYGIRSAAATSLHRNATQARVHVNKERR